MPKYCGVFNLLLNVKDSYILHTEGNKEPGRLTKNLTDILNTEYQDIAKVINEDLPIGVCVTEAGARVFTHRPSTTGS